MNIYISIFAIIFLLIVFVLIGVYNSKKKKKIPISTITHHETLTKADYLTLCDSSLSYVKPIRYPDILTKEECELLKKLSGRSAFDQLLLLIQVFQQLAISKEFTSLNTRPIASHAVIKEQERMHQIYKFVVKEKDSPLK
jgi:hypothetical protein